MIDHTFIDTEVYMKTMSLLILLVVLLAACGPSENAVDIAQAQSVIEAARAAQDAAQAAQIAAQGVSDIGRGQTLILVMLTLIVVVILGLIAYFFVRRLIRVQQTFQQIPSGRWIGGPNAHWRKSEEPDLYRQMLLEQQLLLAQLLSQGSSETDQQDLSELPTDWWG
jgi:hypothetical protein